MQVSSTDYWRRLFVVGTRDQETNRLLVDRNLVRLGQVSLLKLGWDSLQSLALGCGSFAKTFNQTQVTLHCKRFTTTFNPT